MATPRKPGAPNMRGVHQAKSHFHGAALQAEGRRQVAERARSVRASAAAVTQQALPSRRDILEIQAVMLRRNGCTYYEIGQTLEVDQETATLLVRDGARLCLDEDPVTALRVHLLRLEGLLHAWYGEAQVPEPRALPGELSLKAQLDHARLSEVTKKGARDSAALVVAMLAQYERIGTWLAGLPRRGQAVKDDDDHAEIKAILLRADEYGPPPDIQSGVPHGLPALDWKPAGVDEEERT